MANRRPSSKQDNFGRSVNPPNEFPNLSKLGKGNRSDPLLIKQKAATKLAAIFKGKLARAKVELLRRKQAAIERERLEQEVEANRPKPTKIFRPQPRKSGFH